MSESTYKFAMLFVSVFVFPVVGYVVGVLWSKLVDRVFGAPPDPRDLKIWKTFCLALPLFGLGCCLWLGREDIGIWWSNSPYTVFLVFLICLLLVPILLVKLIVRTWQRQDKSEHALFG